MSINNAIEFLKFPHLFFGLKEPGKPDENQRQMLIRHAQELSREFVRYLSQPEQFGKENSNHLFQAIKVMPMSMLYVPDDVCIPINYITLLQENLYYVFRHYQENPSEDLKNILIGSPEYAYYILKNTPSTDDGNILGYFITNPYWALCWLKDNYSQEDYKRFLQNLAEMYHIDPFNTFCVLWLKNHQDPPQLRQQVIANMGLLCKSPMLSLQLALTYPDLAALFFKATTAIHQAPMWLYNWCKHFPSLHQDSMLPVFQEWRPWGAQYLGLLPKAKGVQLCNKWDKEPINKYWKDAWLAFKNNYLQ